MQIINCRELCRDNQIRKNIQKYSNNIGNTWVIASIRIGKTRARLLGCTHCHDALRSADTARWPPATWAWPAQGLAETSVHFVKYILWNFRDQDEFNPREINTMTRFALSSRETLEVVVIERDVHAAASMAAILILLPLCARGPRVTASACVLLSLPSSHSITLHDPLLSCMYLSSYWYPITVIFSGDAPFRNILSVSLNSQHTP